MCCSRPKGTRGEPDRRRHLDGAGLLRAGEFAAVEVTGTAEVVQVSPLRLRLDLTGRDAADAVVRVQGDELQLPVRSALLHLIR